MNYFLKFKNFATNPLGTGRLHYEVLKEKGQVIWGQWRTGKNLLNEKIKEEMKTNLPFTLYVIDTQVALLKLTVTDVLTREEVIENKMEHLIPTYYSIDTPCSAYYVLSDIEILPVAAGDNIVNINTKKPITLSQQVNSTTPWRVRSLEEGEEPAQKVPESTPIIPSPVDVEPSGTGTYSVYRYYCPLLNKYYIGMTNNIDRRRREHENPETWKNNRKKFLYTAMQFVGGPSMFEFTILHSGLTEEEAHYWEAKEIENHNCYYPNGFNERSEKRYLK
jgi:hypothetical protein